MDPICRSAQLVDQVGPYSILTSRTAGQSPCEYSLSYYFPVLLLVFFSHFQWNQLSGECLDAKLPPGKEHSPFLLSRGESSILSDMPQQEIQQLHQWIDQNEAALLQTLQDLLRIPSIEGEPAENAPFGIENRQALDSMLKLACDFGMKTHDVEGYCGWAEFGEGKNLILILGHLDVVPVGPGWKFDPFGATIDGDYLYSRGAVDDKGPTVAAFYAAKAIMECFPAIGARIRTVFGCNEESGFKCIERYVQTEELPTYGFAPDAGWPLYHAEKGITNLQVTSEPITGEMAFVSLEGGQRTNIVIDSAEGVVRIAATARKDIEEKLAKNWDHNLTYSWDGDLLKVHAKGKAAHGSWPHGGDNAAIRILRFWMEISPVSTKIQYEEWFELTHIGGSGIGVDGRDEISELTCNLGIVRTEGGKLKLTFNLRYPVTWKGPEIAERSKKVLAQMNNQYTLEQLNDSEPLYFPLEHPLVKTVLDAYEAETGEKRKPGVMGGGTYARAVPNCVAIGTGWAGDGEAHQTDERIKVAHLTKMAKIYAHILYKLAKL